MRRWLVAIGFVGCGGIVATPQDGAPPDVTSIPDGEKPPTTQCTAAGGSFCTEARWIICPAGYAPVDANDHLGCDIDGWCCAPAPSSPCTNSGQGNCVPQCGKMGSSSCWILQVSLDCPTGLTCCTDGCD